MHAPDNKPAEVQLAAHTAVLVSSAKHSSEKSMYSSFLSGIERERDKIPRLMLLEIAEHL